ncbi:MAG: TolC family protein [Selenomonadales bacterium]|nr:TolC family protein [Selenomonadales bacterium]
MYNMKKMRAVLAALAACGILSAGTALAAPVELTLEDSVNLALENNPQVKIAMLDEMKAEASLDEAEANRGFTLGYVHNAGRSKMEGFTAENSFSNGLTLSLPLYTGGRLENAIDAAEIALESAKLGVNDTRQQLRMDTTNSYYSILQAQNQVTIYQQTVESLEEHLRNVKAQYHVGTVAKSDVLRSEVELADAQQGLIKAENARDLSVSNFNNVVGLPLDTDVRVTEELGYEKYDLVLADCIAYALEHRADGKQAQLAIDAAEEYKSIAKSGYRPSITASASNGWSDSDFPGTEDESWQIGAKLSWNIFDMGATKAQVRQADADLLTAKELARQKLDAIQLEVRMAYLDVHEAEKRIHTSQVSVDKAEEDLKIARVRYRAGVGTNLDVMDAQVALTTAKMNYVQSLYDYNTSKAELDRAMGISI